jgi:hypothetical protein
MLGDVGAGFQSNFHYFNKGVIKSNNLLASHLEGLVSFKRSPLELGGHKLE